MIRAVFDRKSIYILHKVNPSCLSSSAADRLSLVLVSSGLPKLVLDNQHAEGSCKKVFFLMAGPLRATPPELNGSWNNRGSRYRGKVYAKYSRRLKIAIFYVCSA